MQMDDGTPFVPLGEKADDVAVEVGRVPEGQRTV